jgi:beta-glucosidase
VRIWQIDEATIDDAARRILRLIARTGKLDGEELGETSGRVTPGVNTPEHQALARELAEEAITLLKNEGDLLPLNLKAIQRLAVIGPNAAEIQVSGGGSSRVTPPYQVSPLEALQERLGGWVEIGYEPGCSYERGPLTSRDSEGIRKAVDLARDADFVLVCAGMPKGYETEGQDRPDLELPGPQGELIRAVTAANPRTVVVLNCGAPVAMPWIDEAPAVLLAYYPGLEGGRAIARILFGEINPSGKLPVTFPRRLQDTPAFINYPGTMEVHYGEGIFVGYRYYDMKDVEPLFPFGFGLSYTTFEYEGLKAPAEAKMGEAVRVAVTVKNTGSCAGKEVVQLYLGDREASLPRPVKELKSFRKVWLDRGTSQRIEFTLDPRAFAFYDPYRKDWVVEPGEFEILVGSSSRQISLRSALKLMP